MNIQKRIYKILDTSLNLVTILSLIIAGLYAGYGLWDNHRIYAEAQNVQDDMLQYKPTEEAPGFDELLKINPDVKAWLTIDNTNIDYPVLQGKTNLSYFNTDVYGEFSLAGSIFLDTRNDEHFTDSYSLIYGHHVENSKMFGDLDFFKDESFFRNNQTGELRLPGSAYDLQIFATLVVKSGEQSIFNPNLWQENNEALKHFTEQNKLFVDEETLEIAFSTQEHQILSLTTCSTEFTDARTVVLALMIPKG